MSKIKRARFSDIASLEAIDTATGFNERPVVHLEHAHRGRTVIALVGDTAIGYLRSGWLIQSRRAPMIEMIRIIPDHQRQGIGRALVNEAGAAKLEEGYTHLYSSVAQQEAGAWEFLEHVGFEPCGHVQLRDQADPQIIFSKDLRPIIES